MLKVNDFHSSNCHFSCPLPRKTSFSSTDSCRGGHLDQKTGGRTLVRKGAGSFVGFFKCRKYFAERCWWCFTYVPKVEVILVRTLELMMSFKCVIYKSRRLLCAVWPWQTNAFRQVEDLRYVPQHRLESWGVPLKLHLSWQQVWGGVSLPKLTTSQQVTHVLTKLLFGWPFFLIDLS